MGADFEVVSVFLMHVLQEQQELYQVSQVLQYLLHVQLNFDPGISKIAEETLVDLSPRLPESSSKGNCYCDYLIWSFHELKLRFKTLRRGVFLLAFLVIELIRADSA